MIVTLWVPTDFHTVWIFQEDFYVKALKLLLLYVNAMLLQLLHLPSWNVTRRLCPCPFSLDPWLRVLFVFAFISLYVNVHLVYLNCYFEFYVHACKVLFDWVSKLSS